MITYINKKTGQIATLYSEHTKSKTVILVLQPENRGIVMTMSTFHRDWEEVKK